jgi:hypothetical protein
MEKTCYFCGEYVDDLYSIEIADDKKKVVFSGHKECVDDVYWKVKEMDKKLSVDKVLKKLNVR